MDDRKSKMLHDERERERRQARAAILARQAAAQETAPIPSSPEATEGMPGSGHTLGMNIDGPPPYDNED